MAINAAKQLLDELMGRERDLAPNEKRPTLNWNDPSVCKYSLVKFCPNSLFINTKADIGPCHLVHDDCLTKEFQERATRREKRQMEDEFIRFVQFQLNDVERRIKRAKQRLEASQTDRSGVTNTGIFVPEGAQERIKDITEKIEKLLEDIERLGCEGKVEEAREAMIEVDQLKEERAYIKRENKSGHWIVQKAEMGVAQEKQMEVCDVCGAFLIVNDVQQRVDDHLMGKQHVGYGKLKAALDEIMDRRRREEGHGSLSNSTASGTSPAAAIVSNRRSTTSDGDFEHRNRSNDHHHQRHRSSGRNDRAQHRDHHRYRGSDRARDHHHRSSHRSSFNRSGHHRSRSRSPPVTTSDHHHRTPSSSAKHKNGNTKPERV